MNRPRTAALVLSAALMGVSLSGCAYLGPRADATLATLAHNARVDAESASDPEYAALRARQADELATEMAEECGRRADGNPPQTCDVNAAIRDSSAVPEPQSPEDTVAALVHKADEVPQRSRALLMAHALDIAANAAAGSAPGGRDTIPGGTTPIPPPQVSPTAAPLLQALLARTDGAIYALSAAQAFTTGAPHLNVVNVLSPLREGAAQLRAVLASRGESSADAAKSARALVPELSYDYSAYGDFSSSDATAKTVREVLEDMVTAWRYSATQADNAEVRLWLTWLSAAIEAERLAEVR